jgi:hypothetical protein
LSADPVTHAARLAKNFMALVSVQTPSRLQLVAETNATFLSGRNMDQPPDRLSTPPANAPGGTDPLAWLCGLGRQGASAHGGNLGSSSDETDDDPVVELLRADVPSLEYWLDVNG